MEPFVLQKLENGCELFFIKGWMDRHAGLSAGFTSRLGGTSKKPFGGLNCGLHVNDIHEDVITNRERLAQALRIGLEQCTYAEQVHGNEVQIISKEHAGAGVRSREQAIQAKDAFITNEPGLFLHALFADCVPLFFFDPVRRAIGLAHAGWKGTVLQIARKTAEAMKLAFGSEPGDMLAAIGPSIRQCCYEVDEQVISRIKQCMAELNVANDPENGDAPVYIDKGNGKYNLSLQQMNRQIMIKAGILPSRIEMSSLCTSCRTDLFFSHRKENGQTGRMAAWIGLYEQGLL